MIQSSKVEKSKLSRGISMFSLILFLLLTALYIYYLRTGAAKEWLTSIRHLGFLGVVIGIIIQIIVNTLPVPGEFVSIFLIEVYGVVLGGLYTWIGGILGAILAFYLSRWLARPLIEPLAKPYLEKVDRWLQKKGDIGLLLIRFVPLVPYHFVNYASGLLRVNIKAFIWTTAIGILPFTITISSLYAGLRQGKMIPFMVGGGLFIMSAILSFFLRKKID
jgi:uncharacterized membrane protein YdjX (TVP38/TMEM64 family)